MPSQVIRANLPPSLEDVFEVFGTLASTLRVLWKNSKADLSSGSAYLRPHDLVLDGAVAGGTLTTAVDSNNNAVPCLTNGLPFLDLFHFISGSTSSGADLKVRVYGRVRFHSVDPSPGDLSSNFDKPDHPTYVGRTPPGEDLTLEGVPQIWIPLFKPGTTTPTLTFTAGGEESKKTRTDSSGHAYMLHSQNNYVWCGGVDAVVVMPEQAATSITAGCILGMFRG